ncbi:hypothetical protein K0U00_35915, partial [Paenibacillus sepulcri]|nr:hypothetical protein [Paenibacillus sepulcri]
PGTDYLLRLIVTGGLHAGESNRVAVTTNSAEQPGGGGDEPEPEPEPEPDPVIVGVLDGQIYASYVTPERAEGRTIVSAALVKDGEEDEFYELGDEIRESGSYELTVTDDSQSRTTIRFTLVPDAQLTVINDEQYQVAYNTRDHMLSIPVHVVNAGADYAGAVNGVKLNAPGLAKDVDMLTVEYGNSGSGPYAYFYLYREPGTDHFSGTFPPYPYTLTGGWDENVTYSVQLLPSLTDRTIRVDAWVAFEQDSSQEHAIASIQTVNLIAEADPLAPISDLEVLYTSDTTTYASYTMPLLATEVNLEISEDDGETWQNAQTDSPVTPDASFVQVLGLNPGTAYRLRLSVADGVNAGQSNEVIFTTEPEDHT